MTAQCANPVEVRSTRGRGVLLATVLGSGLSFLDGLVVNVALPKMDESLKLGVTGFQWTVSGYLMTLSALLLVGGSLGDIFGRRKIYIVGIALFTLSSLACGLAPNAHTLVIARLLQGAAGALMVPASLAIIQASFVEVDRGRAIGLWTGLASIFTAGGPFVGGAFVTYVSWRWAFFINVPLGVAAVWATLNYVPESRSDDETRRLDLVGAALAGCFLAGITYWAIEGSGSTSRGPMIFGLTGIAALFALVVFERRTRHPMLPPSLFKAAQFNWVNLCTLIFYGAFVSGVTLSGVRLQTELGYDALEAGIAGLPVSFEMILLAGRFGALAQRIGARIPMTVGPAIVAVGLVGLSQLDAGRGYWTFVFPLMLLWGFGLSMTVAPLTAAALAAADQRHVGVASAFNNAAASVGRSLAIALIPALAGMGGAASLSGAAFDNGYEKALLISAGLAAIAAALACVFVSGRTKQP